MPAGQPASRRSFLRGKFRESGPLRPVGALPEAAFLDQCSTCGDCARACPEDVIVMGDGGFPQLSFTNGACTFCAACVEACPEDVLRIADRLPATAVVAKACLSLNAVQCRSCQDTCDARAISFKLMLGGSAQPLIDTEACTGCGACVAGCPVGALSVKPNPQRAEVYA